MNEFEKNKLYDPIRKKEVSATPEEYVRQATIQYLLNEVKVPARLISVEFSLSLIDSRNDDRVDILVHNFRDGETLNKPWLLVECKAPGEYSWEILQLQLNRYLKLLTPNYVMLALGDAVRYFRYDFKTRRFVKIETLPLFK